jgi:hypothetical protein
MKGKLKDLPVMVELPELTCRYTEWGDMGIESSQIRMKTDPAPLFNGLPDNRCQCPHWGYVVKGTVRFRFPNREEAFHAGEAYYAEPGHTPILEAGTVYVEFSPKDKIRKTFEVIERNLNAKKEVLRGRKAA